MIFLVSLLNYLRLGRFILYNSNMSNEQSRKEVWEGKIPVCFIPDSREVPTGGNVMPEPCFVSSKLLVLEDVDVNKTESGLQN